MNFFLRKDLLIHSCSECKMALEDKQFVDCGLLLTPPEGPRLLYFDYTCPACGFFGRWTFPIPEDMTPWDAVKSLAECFIQTPDPNAVPACDESIRLAERRDIATKLTKINSVEDLLKLGGNDAPREPSKRDNRDLP